MSAGVVPENEIVIAGVKLGDLSAAKFGAYFELLSYVHEMVISADHLPEIRVKAGYVAKAVYEKRSQPSKVTFKSVGRLQAYDEAIQWILGKLDSCKDVSEAVNALQETKWAFEKQAFENVCDVLDLTGTPTYMPLGVSPGA